MPALFKNHPKWAIELKIPDGCEDRKNEYNISNYRQAIQCIQFTVREEPEWSKRTALTPKDFFLEFSGLALRYSFPQAGFGLCSVL